MSITPATAGRIIVPQVADGCGNRGQTAASRFQNLSVRLGTTDYELLKNLQHYQQKATYRQQLGLLSWVGDRGGDSYINWTVRSFSLTNILRPKG